MFEGGSGGLSGRGPRLLRFCLGVETPYGILPKQTSKKFAFGTRQINYSKTYRKSVTMSVIRGFLSDSVKRHLRGRHLSVLNLKFDFISDGGCTREEQIALSLKRHLFPHGGRESKAFWICFSRVRPPSEIKSNFKFKTLKRHLLKRHLTLSDSGLQIPTFSCFRIIYGYRRSKIVVH